MIGIIDYGSGNLKSVKKAFEFLNIETKFVKDKADLRDVNKVVLPGVGAFGYAADRLKKQDLFNSIKEWILVGKSFLGICLGMQLMLEKSMESELISGFSVIPGYCDKFKLGKVPQIGWNTVNFNTDNSLFNGIEQGSYFYFVHGYYPILTYMENSIAKTDYNITFTSAIRTKNSYGVQFHPEKSGDLGLKVLENWVTLC